MKFITNVFIKLTFSNQVLLSTLQLTKKLYLVD